MTAPDDADRILPVTPEQVSDLKLGNIPDTVIDVINKLIARNMRLGRAVVKQNDIIAELRDRGFPSDEVYSRHWLDFEDVYRTYGWHVEYDKPGWNESYDAVFRFTVPNGKHR